MRRGNFVADHMIELILVAALVFIVAYFVLSDDNPGGGQIDELKKNATGALGVPKTASSAGFTTAQHGARPSPAPTSPRGASITTFK